MNHYPTSKPIQNITTESQILLNHHQFIRDTDTSTWESRLAQKYYDRLFKEFALCHLKRYKENKIAMRWRTENEVVDGKGQFICADLECLEKDDLRSWEVPFGYTESGEKKLVLVKLKLCPGCSLKLNYGKMTKKRKLSDDTDKVETQPGETEHEKEKVEEEDEVPEEEEEENNTWNAPIDKESKEEAEQDFDSYLKDLFK